MSDQELPSSSKARLELEPAPFVPAITRCGLAIPDTLIWDQLVADLGPLYEPPDTEWTVLEAQAVLALVERAP